MTTNETVAGAMRDALVEARGLTKSFGEVRAVVDVSFTVGPGQIVGVLGPNGAGKTTTITMMTTLSTIDRGSALVGGYDVTTQPDVVRQLIGVAGQAAAVDEKLTTRENLELFGRLYKLPRADRRLRTETLIRQFDMAEFADRPAETYSGGQRRRLDVVAALVADPPALFLDEPTAGLDPRSRSELWDAIRALADRGTAIVLTTQYLEEADQLADHILLIDHGRIVAEGTPAELKKDLERDVLEIRLPDTADVDRTVEAIGHEGEMTVDRRDRTLSIPVGDDPAKSLEILSRVRDKGIPVSDFQLRRPTLDDVFLALTGAREPAQTAGASVPDAHDEGADHD